MIRECAGYGMGGVVEGLISRWGEKAETIWLCAQFVIAMERQRLKQSPLVCQQVAWVQRRRSETQQQYQLKHCTTLQPGNVGLRSVRLLAKKDSLSLHPTYYYMKIGSTGRGRGNLQFSRFSRQEKRLKGRSHPPFGSRRRCALREDD